MTITLEAAEQKELNVQLTPIVSEPVVTIDQMFIGTRPYPSKGSADDRLYIRIRNLGTNSLSGVLKIYDWQAWWEQQPGDDRRWKSPVFTIAPGATFSYTCSWRHLAFDTTYIRAEVVVNDVVIAETPRVYIIPGKYYSGPGSTAQGQCTHKAPGLAVLWYSQDSECSIWDGSYKTPTTGDPIHRGSFAFRTYNNNSWPAAFCVVLDPELIAGATYQAYIKGASPGAATRATWFTFTAA